MATSAPTPTLTHPRTRTTHPQTLLHHWHLLSLDAPTVATLWTCFIALSAHIHLPLLTPLSMFLTVWLLYAADRLLDARQLVHNPLQKDDLEARHHFHHLHRNAFLAGIVCTSIVLAVIIPRLPAEALHLYLVLGALLAGYFVLIHATSSSNRLPKELAVGLFFAAAAFIPTVARRPDLRLTLLAPVLLFALLCSLNCLFIYAWEHQPGAPSQHPPHAATRIALGHLPKLALTALVLGLLLTLFDTSGPRPLAAACALSILALLLLHRYRRRLSRLTLRAAADLALLTPLLYFALAPVLAFLFVIP